MQQPYLFSHDGHLNALQSLENVPKNTNNFDIFTAKKQEFLDPKRPKPVAMSRRNARERRRVKMINTGYETLRHHVPAGTENKKLSKVETLRAAVDYIKYLQNLLSSDDALSNSPPQIHEQIELRTTTEDSYSHGTVKQENCFDGSCCSLQESEDPLSPLTIPQTLPVKEEGMFIDIAQWLCQNSTGLKNNNIKLKELSSSND